MTYLFQLDVCWVSSNNGGQHFSKRPIVQSEAINQILPVFSRKKLQEHIKILSTAKVHTVENNSGGLVLDTTSSSQKLQNWEKTVESHY